MLFKADEEYCDLNACIGFTNDEMLLYSSGYIEAAKLLTNIVCLGKNNVDTLFYPIVFLHRYHIELAFKSLIVIGSELLQKSLNSKDIKALENHNLNDLWKCFKPIFCQIYHNVSNVIDVADGMESYIKQISAIDLSSFSFRYPKTKDRKKRNLQNIMHINIYIFSEHINKLIELLDGCDNHWRDLLDQMYQNM